MPDFGMKDSGARQEFATGARRDLQDGKGRPDLIPTLFIQRLAVVMEKGAAKYGDRNWEQGMPLSRYYASAMRHLMQAFNGETDEDHLGQCAFNVSAFMWTQQQIRVGALDPALDDLPKGRAVESNIEAWVGEATALLTQLDVGAPAASPYEPTRTSVGTPEIGGLPGPAKDGTGTGFSTPRKADWDVT